MVSFLGYYYSCQKAGEILEIPWMNIRSCCQEKLQLAGDYQWCYYRDLPKHLDKTPLDLYRYSVEQIDINTNSIIKVWKNAKIAAQSFGARDGSSISKCCKNLQRTAYGYKWQYRNKEKMGRGKYNAI